METDIIIRTVEFGNRDFALLVAELDREFWVRYPHTQQNFEPYNRVDHTARIAVAYRGETPVACGCFRPMRYPKTIEIKRMYTIPPERGKGIARAVLQYLEEQAISEGFELAKLETGIRQPEAIAAYTKAGYHQIPNFAPYEKVEESICMEKRLF